MNPEEIIQKYYKKGSDLYEILLGHGLSVADKAMSISRLHPEMGLDNSFIFEAAVLHDIGIFQTYSPKIHCFGTHPYVCHGYLGSELLKREGFPRHALVCERHTGTGISLQRIIGDDLPLPHRDMQPQSMEEQLICFADKFFSKSHPAKEKEIGKIRSKLSKRGQVEKFDEWCRLFLE
ncbi:MAG: HDIG domain-containing protein [Dysgonamonadaceae bacterium]|jgi:uncharacterized protein|nr:HDIG domain-containing protein [Dysgonamonadaceae bacterium]